MLFSVPNEEDEDIMITYLNQLISSRNLEQLDLVIKFLVRYINFAYFYAPGLKGPPGASSNWIIHRFVCLSICKFHSAFKQGAIFKVWVMMQ